jgi:FkbM family methyltransferase
MVWILQLLRWLKYHNPTIIRKAINMFYYNPETTTLQMKNLDYLVVDNCLFGISNQVDSIQKAKDNPWFDNIRHSDVVLDIGANIGAITIPLAKTAKRVYAVEPLFVDELKKNIELNGLKNVQVIECGLGKDSTTARIKYGLRESVCRLISIESILRITGKIDFLKVDCEGAEWLIEPERLDGIREIRMELHIRRHSRRSDLKRMESLLYWLRQNDYQVDVQRNIQAAPDISFAECILLNASKK